MFFKKVTTLFSVLLLCIHVFAQQAKILAGPMLGYCEHKEVMIWVMTGCAQKLTINYAPVFNNKDRKSQEVILFENSKDPSSKPAKYGNGERQPPISSLLLAAVIMSMIVLTTVLENPMGKAPKFSIPWPMLKRI